jgi:hypothetical protein
MASCGAPSIGPNNGSNSRTLPPEFNDCFLKVKSPKLFCVVGTVAAPDEDIARDFARINGKLLILDAFQSQVTATVEQLCSTSKATDAEMHRGELRGEAQASIGGFRTPPLSGTAEGKAIASRMDANKRCKASEAFSQLTSIQLMGLQTSGWYWDNSSSRAYVIMTAPYEALRAAVKLSAATPEQKQVMLEAVEAFAAGRP